MRRLNILKLLSRRDKWYLGGADRILWAPPFPLFLDSPGFWDEAQYFNVELKPVFTWTLLDDDGKEVPLKYSGWTWNPAVLTQSFRSPGLTIIERKSCQPDDLLCSSITISNTTRRRKRLHLIAWTAQPTYPSKRTTWIADAVCQRNSIVFTKHLLGEQHPELRIHCALTLGTQVKSHSINLSEGTTPLPRWELTPFYEKFHRKLPREKKVTGVTDDGVLYLALHTELTIPPRQEENVEIAFAASQESDRSLQNATTTAKSGHAIKQSESAWREYFHGVPYFECSDEWLTRYYWYRWYGLKLNTIRATEGNYNNPFVCEGIGYFRAPISYSAQCHILENRWMHSPELAQGSLLTFIDNQRDDGGFRGYIDPNYYRPEMFYHANWGRVLRELHAVHPSLQFLQSVYDGLRKYARYFDRERDAEASGLYDIDNHYETGQEFMSRYTAVNPNADTQHWGDVFRLKGVDVTVYIYELKRALAEAATMLGKTDEASLLEIEAHRIKSAILSTMWDPEEEMFFDVDPATGRQTKVKAATCFYPYMTDIVDARHLNGLKRHLLNPKEFWTPFPVPSTSRDDPTFSPEPEWKGKRMNCPWNGRVWPMTNSHIAEALAQTAIRFNDPFLKKKAVEFITKFIRMMFFDGDPTRPNCFEHYNPVTGQPSIYRGVDDYQHSWVVDLIIKYVCGVRPEEKHITIDPFPFGIRNVLLEEAIVRGRRIRVEIKGHRFSVWIDGKPYGKQTIGRALDISI